MKALPPIPRPLFWGVILVGVGAILFGASYNPAPGGLKHAWGSAAMQQSRAIGSSLYAYATDHDLKYPDGQSSTEVFQKLMDEGYVTDPTLFYLPLAGKTKGDGKTLKPENVCFDVTSGLIEGSSPDEIPAVFMTGYSVTYVPGGAAIKRPNQAALLDQDAAVLNSGLAVMYMSHEAKFFKADASANPGDSIRNFIAPSFKPDGHTYRQLTPEGVLPP